MNLRGPQNVGNSWTKSALTLTHAVSRIGFEPSAVCSSPSLSTSQYQQMETALSHILCRQSMRSASPAILTAPRLCTNFWTSSVPRNFVRGVGGVQQIKLRTEDREKGDLAAVAP